jgi:hypothetical protein
MNTFIDLYNYFQSIDNLQNFLNNDIIKCSGDKLENTFKLFSYLGLISDFSNYYICDGNYTECTINKNKNIKDLFEKSMQNKGDKSDLTLINNKTIIATTIKNLSNYHINKLDIRDIYQIYESKYKQNDFILILCLVVKNKKDIYNLCRNSNHTSSDLVNFITNKNTLIYDYDDIYSIFKIFKNNFTNININNLIKTNKSKIIFKYHQEVSIYKTKSILSSYNDCLWCHIARSGKSYIISGYILEDSKSKDKCNYLIITTAPKETIEQYKEIFNTYYDFNDFNIINQENIKKPKINNKNIIICSKQFLQSKDDKKTKKIKWLSDLNIDIRFIDESHNGGTTEIAKSTFDTYGTTAKNIYITATYLKPLYNYNISTEQQILFNAYHIHLLKNIENKENYDKIIELFDNDKIIDNYDIIDIKNYYNKLPELHYITESLNKDTKELIKDINGGYSLHSVFMLKHNSKVILNEFKNEEEVEKLIKSIFGISKINDLLSITDNSSLLKRCEIIAKNPEFNSRWFSNEEPLIILCFLPCNCENLPIDILSETLKTFIETKKLLEDYEIVCINSKNENKDYNPIDIIDLTRNKAIINNKKGVIVFAGKKCSLGITIKKCDIVILMTNIVAYDTIFQMMYRCMTEDDNKKCGFVIDLNLQRSIDFIVNYGLTICPNKSSKEAVKYILEQKLINFNIDLWYEKIFGIKEINFNDILNKIYLLFSNKSCNSINKILDNIDFKLSLFSKDDQEIIKQLFKINYEKLEKSKIYETDDIDIKDGIEKTKVANEIIDNKSDISSIEDKEVKKDEINIDYFNEIIKKFIPLICLITISNDDLITFNEIIDYINDNEYLKSIIEETINTWCNKKNKDTLIIFNKLYNTYFKYNTKFNNIIIEIKEIFKLNLYNKNELSKSIDKYLVPHINEKKQNAEVSTPACLRKEMLDKIPDEFWKTPKKVFEPCSGKAGFLIDIADKFMEGLKEKFEDEEERYRVIVEDCLYFSDINKQNIFIANLVLDPYKKYKLNANEGDTLKLDIKTKWNLEGFDAVIGNPPYNDASGNKGKGHCIWTNFVEKALKEWLKENGYLVYIHPSLWRQYENSLLKIMKEKQIIYLEIHNIKDGLKTFNCSTRYDWYILENKKNYKKTIIKDEDNELIEENLNEWLFIPNKKFKEIKELCNSNEKLDVNYYRSNYGSDKKWVNKNKSTEYKYPCIYSINKKNELSLLYSKINTNGHFTKTKFIFSNGCGFYKDYLGDYGLTEWSYCIYDEPDNLENIEKAFRSIKFNIIKEAIQIDSKSYNIKVMKLFKKDFYKDFI